MVDIDRRGYGRRYSMLMVDQISREGFEIDFQNAYMRSDQFDICPDDVVRWRDGERFTEAIIETVHVEPQWLRVRFREAHPLTAEQYYA